MTIDDEDWRKYEEEIFDVLQEAGGPNAEVKFDHELPGRFSGVSRQLDVWIKGQYLEGVEEEVTAAVDCKFYTRNVDVKGVETFLGLVDDVGTDLGFLITTKGFSPGAKLRAKNGSRGIRLKTMPAVFLTEFDDFHNPTVSDLYDAFYDGTYWEGPRDSLGASVRFNYVQDFGYSLDPEVEPEWIEEILISEAINVVAWGDDAARAEIARTILRHHAGEEPDDDYIRTFVDEIAKDWEDGQPWSVTSAEVARHTGL